METGHISQNTDRAIHLVSGSVEIITEGKRLARKVAKFENIMVAGTTDEEIRKNFRYEKAFPWEARKAIREMEAKGLVRLLDYQLGKCLGLKRGEHPAPGTLDVYEQLI